MSLHGKLAASSFHGDFEASVNSLQACTLVMTNLWQACTLVMTNLWQACTLVMTNLWQACCKLKLLSGYFVAKAVKMVNKVRDPGLSAAGHSIPIPVKLASEP
ncbi:hypothetical protein AVEN_22041-1 [Araneus ventricosus]|uniref:Uncharacterized protein n=1 Tax=Araneus ventricosus TaxID=182803 RepID=A0A4Y2RZF4_ARAVE|nr:hypothetical protein AVEN_22041-1 [Araneus ventricosus]